MLGRIGLERLLFERSSVLRCRKFPIFRGMFPVRWFIDKLNVSNCIRFVISSGFFSLNYSLKGQWCRQIGKFYHIQALFLLSLRLLPLNGSKYESDHWFYHKRKQLNCPNSLECPLKDCFMQDLWCEEMNDCTIVEGWFNLIGLTVGVAWRLVILSMIKGSLRDYFHQD